MPGKFRTLVAVLGWLGVLVGAVLLSFAALQGRMKNDLIWYFGVGYIVLGFLLLIIKYFLSKRSGGLKRTRRHYFPDLPMSNDGAVLIMTLLFVSMLAALALHLHYTVRMSSSMDQRLWTQTRLRAALVDEALFAVRMLATDPVIVVDHLNELWAQEWEQERPDDITVRGRITDLNRYIDLNNIAMRDDFPEEERMRRMLADAMIRAGDLVPEERLRALADWIKPDEGIYGEAFYMQLDPPYRPAANWLETWGELKWIHGFGNDYFARTLPTDPDEPPPLHLSDLVEIIPGPRARPTRININTASREVLEIVLGVGQEPLVRQLLLNRAERPFRSIEALLPQMEPTRYLAVRPFLDVRSTHFRIDVQGVLADNTSTLSAWVRRSDDGDMEMIQWVW